MNSTAERAPARHHGNQALETIVRQGCALVSAGRCAILVGDAGGEWLICAALSQAAQYGADGDWSRLRLPVRAFDTARETLAATTEPLVVADARQSTLFSAGAVADLDIRSVLLAPLHRDGTLIGVLTLDDPGMLRAFTARECQLAAALAQLAGTALAVAWSEAHNTHLRRVESGLRDLVIQVAQMSTPRAIMEAVVARVLSVFRADAAASWLYGQEQRLALVAASGFSPSYLATAQDGYRCSPGYAAFAERRAVYCADRGSDADPLGQAAARDGIRSMLFLPLLVEGRPIGLLILAHHAIRAYDQQVIAQAEGFAQQAALAVHTTRLLRTQEELAVENARLYQAESARARQLDALLRLSERLHASRDFDALLQEVVDAVTSTLGFRIAVLNVREGPPGRFVARAIAGADADERALLVGSISSDWHLFLRPEFRTGRCYIVPPEYTRSIHTESPFVIPDLPPARAGEWDPYHALFVPIGGEGIEAAAVLSVDEPLDRRLPSSATLAALEAFAAQAALALEKARLLAETQRRAGELEGIIGSITDAVILIGLNGVEQPLNQAARLLLQPGGGLAPDRRAGLRDVEGSALRPDQWPLARALRGEYIPPIDLLAPMDGDGACWLSVTGAPVLNAYGGVEAAVVVVRDVTAERDIERVRRQFVATVSHELRTPLSAIVGFTELLDGRWDEIDAERKRSMLRSIIASSERLERLVSDLLLLSHVEAGELRVRPGIVDLIPVLKHAAAEAQARFPGQVIALAHAEQPLLVWADRHRAQQVFSNLLDNAAKYAGDAGGIEVSWLPAERHLVIKVADHGAGVPPAQRSKLFTRFGKLDHQKMRGGYVGTGLGLFICRKLVEAMDGTIWYEDTAGGGGTFAVSLPIAPPRAGQPRGA